MDFDQFKRPIIGKKDVVSRLQSKVAAQAKEISRLRDEIRAVRDDLVDVIEQRNKLRDEKNEQT